MNRAWLIVLWIVAGCESPPPEAAATAPLQAGAEREVPVSPRGVAEGAGGSGAPDSAPDGAPVAADDAPTAAPDAAQSPVDDADAKDAALLLGHGVRNRLAAGDLGPWLAQRAAYPFDLDGKELARSPDELAAKLPRHLEAWTRQTTTQTRCEALSREEILAGAPLHYLDRLGRRPPSTDLARDLGRFGLDPGELFVNCYTPDQADAGYTLIVSPGPRIQAFRN